MRDGPGLTRRRPRDSRLPKRINSTASFRHRQSNSIHSALRLDKPGRHGVVAICNATAKRPQGIGHDFERQRFTVLGDWRTFLLQTTEREAEYQKTQEDLRKFRTGAGSAETLDEQLPQGTEAEARAGLTVEVK